MGAGAWAGYGLLFKFTGSNTIALILAIGFAVVVYFALILLLRAINRDDLSLMPKGDKIGKLLRIK